MSEFGYMGFDTDDLEVMTGEDLQYKQTGVLWVEGYAVYIIDMYRDSDSAHVWVYDVDKATDPYPQKAFELHKVPLRRRFANTMKLGKYFASKSNQSEYPEEKDRKVTKGPLFVAPVLPGQISTFTGKMEPCFFEREPDFEDRDENGQPKLVRGDNTGVNIGLSSVTWIEEPKIDPMSVVNSVNGRSPTSFHDFKTGSQPKSPLNAYYDQFKE